MLCGALFDSEPPKGKAPATSDPAGDESPTAGGSKMKPSNETGAMYAMDVD